MAPTNNSKATSPVKKGRKPLSPEKLPFSPRTRLNINKVYVIGTHFGLILIRTEKLNSKDDGFTNNGMKLIEDPNNDAGKNLSIIKICPRRQSQKVDEPIMQTTNYASQWFVAITDEAKNTAKYREEVVNKFITFMNGVDWLYKQQFIFSGDETKMVGGNIVGTVDMLLLNIDIAAILKQYIFEDWDAFEADKAAIAAVFGGGVTARDAKERLYDMWENTPDL